MAGPEAARPSTEENHLRTGWLATLGVAFVGQLLSWWASFAVGPGLVLIGVIVVSLLVGFATPGPWIAGAAGIVLASVVAWIGVSVQGASVYGVLEYLIAGVSFALLLFTPFYMFASAARFEDEWPTPSPDSPGMPDADRVASKTGMSRQTRVGIGVLFVLFDALLVAVVVSNMSKGI